MIDIKEPYDNLVLSSTSSSLQKHQPQESEPHPPATKPEPGVPQQQQSATKVASPKQQQQQLQKRRSSSKAAHQQTIIFKQTFKRFIKENLKIHKPYRFSMEALEILHKDFEKYLMQHMKNAFEITDLHNRKILKPQDVETSLKLFNRNRLIKKNIYWGSNAKKCARKNHVLSNASLKRAGSRVRQCCSMAKEIYPIYRSVADIYMEEIIEKSVLLLQNSKHVIIQAFHIRYVLKNLPSYSNNQLY